MSGSIQIDGQTVTVNDATHFAAGDWIQIRGEKFHVQSVQVERHTVKQVQKWRVWLSALLHPIQAWQFYRDPVAYYVRRIRKTMRKVRR